MADGSLVGKEASFNDTVMLKVAREIAMDIKTIDDILKAHGLTTQQFETISTHPRFTQYVRQCIEEWESAANTAERVKIKSLAMVEDLLAEFYLRAVDPKEALPAKIEILKTVAKFGNIGTGGIDGAVSGERLSVTINLGADHQLKIERDVTPQGNLIEGDTL